MTSEPPPPRPLRRVLRRWGPWVLGLGILAIVVTRIPFSAFRDAVSRGPIAALLLVNVVSTVMTLWTDSVATWVGLIAMRMRRPLTTIVAVRGATYLLFLLNYAVWQGSFGYYLHRTGVSGLRATGATLFLAGTNLAMLLLVTGGAYAVQDVVPPTTAMTLTLAIGCGGFGVYLLLIAAAPPVLARRELFAPLFAAGVRGHLLALAGRIPHAILMILCMWTALRVWGIAVPLLAGVVLIPIIVLAAVVPISPAGLGTMQALFVVFFGRYAAGATPDDRTATILAFAVAHFVLGVCSSLAVGAVCATFARSLRLAPPVVPPAECPPEGGSDPARSSSSPP